SAKRPAPTWSQTLQAQESGNEKRQAVPHDLPTAERFVRLLETAVLYFGIEQVRLFVFPQRASKSLLVPQKVVRPWPLPRARFVSPQPSAALVPEESRPAFLRCVQSIALFPILSLAVPVSASWPLQLAPLL